MVYAARGVVHRPPGGDQGRCALPLSGAEGLQGRGVAQFRDGCHALGGEHAPALQLPVLVLLQQHRPHQAGDGGVVGEGADDTGEALDELDWPSAPLGATLTRSSRLVLQILRQ
jgi:hypothetical protein